MEKLGYDLGPCSYDCDSVRVLAVQMDLDLHPQPLEAELARRLDIAVHIKPYRGTLTACAILVIWAPRYPAAAQGLSNDTVYQVLEEIQKEILDLDRMDQIRSIKRRKEGTP